MLECCHVLKWITIHCDDVGPFPSSEYASLIGPPEQIGRVDGSRLDRLQRSQAQLNHDRKFVSVQPVRIDGSVRAERNFHTAHKRMGDVLAGRRHYVLRFH